MVIDVKSLIWTGPGDVQFPLMLLWAAEIFFKQRVPESCEQSSRFISYKFLITILSSLSDNTNIWSRGHSQGLFCVDEESCNVCTYSKPEGESLV